MTTSNTANAVQEDACSSVIADQPASNGQFIHDLFGPDLSNTHLCSVPDDPNDPTNRGFWKGGPYAQMEPACIDSRNNFYSQMMTSAAARRLDTNWGGAKTFTVDDVGTKVSAQDVMLMLGPPRWIIETSPGCYQWVYRLTETLMDQRSFRAVLAELAARKLSDPGTTKPGQYFRLPVGINGKEKYRGAHPNGFPVRVELWDKNAPDLDWTKLAAKLGVSLAEADLVGFALRTTKSPASGGVDMNARANDQWLDALFELGMVKGQNGNGTVDIVCPWVDEHTAEVDSGSAYLGTGHFKCHHGHCDARGSLVFQTAIRGRLAAMPGNVEGLSGEAWQARRQFQQWPITEAQRKQMARTRGVLEAELAEKDKAAARVERDTRDKGVTQAMRDWAYVSALEKFVKIETGSMCNTVGFNRMMASAGIVPAGSSGQNAADAQFFNKGGAHVDIATYRPGGNVIVREINPAGVSVDALNLWRKPAFAPAQGVTGAAIQLWLDLVARIAPGKSEREALLNWMAYLLQNPGKKINWAPVIVGEMGTGKDTLFLPIIAALGAANVSQIQASHLRDTFNGYLKAQLCIVQEMASFEKLDLYNTMKPYLAAPPHTLMVNEKNVKQYTIPNIICWLMFSNKPDAIAIEPGDRRHFVVSSPLKPLDAAFYDAIHGFYAKRGLELVAGWLMQRDVSAFNPAHAPLWTAAKTEMMLASLNNVGQWIASQFEAGGRFDGRNLVTVKEIIDAATARGAGVPGAVASAINFKAVAAALKALGASQVRSGQQVRTAGGKVRLWAMRRADLYDQMSEGQIDAAWTKEKAAFLPVSAVPI